MSQDPNAVFDEAVLEKIEHSPIGAVPHTPAYDDAVKRLLSAQKIYPDADHKDGYVTARSLARLPSFHAQNWEAFAGGEVASDALEGNASVFGRYVASLAPGLRAAAEAVRLKVAGKPVMHRVRPGHAVFHDPIHSLFLVPGAGPNRGLPGNYLFGSVIQLDAEQVAGAWAVDVHDSEDGVVLFDASGLRDAAAKLAEVLESAPFHLWELEGLGFRRK
ncbi:MAG TPA: hypothetical protein VEQ65_07680 [Opitutus sp.]|nr:hypothetical protein [Opitutus sp.]